MENNVANLAVGTRVTFSSPKLKAMGVMVGAIEDGSDGVVFLPDEKHHDKLYDVYGVEGEEGLYLDGAVVVPV